MSDLTPVSSACSGHGAKLLVEVGTFFQARGPVDGMRCRDGGTRSEAIIIVFNSLQYFPVDIFVMNRGIG